MREWLVPMKVRVRLRDMAVVPVLVMFVVLMAMLMLHRLMGMLMLVSLRQVQPQADAHQKAREQKFECQRLMQQNDGDHRSDKGCGRKIGASTGRSQMSQREHE